MPWFLTHFLIFPALDFIRPVFGAIPLRIVISGFAATDESTQVSAGGTVSPYPSSVSPYPSPVSPYPFPASPCPSSVSPYPSPVSPYPSPISPCPFAVSPYPFSFITNPNNSKMHRCETVDTFN
ncbi:hypothetical protein PoB_005352900 [Plakobranchus ocellatus]|uniref:Uncharacterized protein n=1 Tax=Plakobranchus ocellatus TaxID=259542 RepID=A0AAV4C7I0_9GAST|nr:hypothetical protein PoB_005352900 [Plakobranchus ocellatus]